MMMFNKVIKTIEIILAVSLYKTHKNNLNDYNSYDNFHHRINIWRNYNITILRICFSSFHLIKKKLNNKINHCKNGNIKNTKKSLKVMTLNKGSSKFRRY